jgi:hypothetical protein
VAQAVQPLLKECGCTIVMEPGRAIVGNAGILVTSVLYHKKSGEKQFVIVDAGMNDLIRPSLYEAYHDIRPVAQQERPANVVVDVVGPICESSDFLAKGRKLPSLRSGELIAVTSAGAYGFSMLYVKGVPFVVCMAAGVLVTVIFATCISYPFLRLKGGYFALANFGLIKLFELVAASLRDFTGGTQGISLRLFQPTPKEVKEQRRKMRKEERVSIDLLHRAVPAKRTDDGLRALSGESPIRPET